MRLIISLIIYTILCFPAFGKEVVTQKLDESLVGINIVFVSAGDFLDEDYTRHRVVINQFDVYTILIVEKITGGNEEQEGRIIWSRIIDFGYNDKFLSPKDFMQSFKWISPDSFSFINDEIQYFVENIGRLRPTVKEQKFKKKPQ